MSPTWESRSFGDGQNPAGDPEGSQAVVANPADLKVPPGVVSMKDGSEPEVDNDRWSKVGDKWVQNPAANAVVKMSQSVNVAVVKEPMKVILNSDRSKAGNILDDDEDGE